jgi:eukaryotic-like serine/threonine-protein kinase
VADDVFGIVGTLQGGAFHVEQVVAEGGFAVVYRAHHEAFRAKVALKCLKVPETLTEAQKAQFLERFREEAELLFRLSAGIPTVVRPLHVGTLETPRRVFAPFIALEWLEGKTLDGSIAERNARGLAALSLSEVVRLLAPVARALERAHHFPGPDGEISILHRDLKPENIFVAEVHGTPVIKILDFGIGKVKTAATQIVGKLSARADALGAFTPCYGAPEQWLPQRFGQTGPWTDVWGLALTVIEACSGVTVFQGDQAAVLSAVVDEQRRPTPRGLGVTVPDAVEPVFRKALAVDPRERYSSIELFWSALSGALGAPITEWIASTPEPQPVPDLVVAPRSVPAPAPAPRSRGRVAITRASDDDDFELGSRGPPIALDTEQSLTPPPVSRRVPVAHTVATSRSFRSERSVLAKLEQPIKWVLFGCVLMLADYGFTAVTGEVFSLGPVRAFWIAAPLVLGSIGLGLLRLFSSDH